MTSFITDNLGSTQNALIVAAIAITTIGGSIAMIKMFKAANKEAAEINAIIADFNEKYATS